MMLSWGCWFHPRIRTHSTNTLRPFLRVAGGFLANQSQIISTMSIEAQPAVTEIEEADQNNAINRPSDYDDSRADAHYTPAEMYRLMGCEYPGKEGER